jgi:uncharacterized protein
MFPLGTVLFPGSLLPLHVFEPRYRELMRDCLAGEAEFGVVLIERGSEVGGGDVRSTAGTVAHILEARELEDGRWVLVAAGTRRITVTTWLPDDPYPRADIEDWPDPPADPATLREHRPRLEAHLRRVLGLASELGEAAAPATIELDPDPALALYQACWLAPLGPADKQRLLVCEGHPVRLDLLTSLLEDEARALEFRLAAG